MDSNSAKQTRTVVKSTPCYTIWKVTSETGVYTYTEYHYNDGCDTLRNST